MHLFPEQIVGFFGITNESLRDFTVFAPQRCSCSCRQMSASDRGLNYFRQPGSRSKSIFFLSLTRQILFLVPLLIVLPMVLPAGSHQFVSLDALYFLAPTQSDFLTIFTTVVFIVLEMGRLEKLESGGTESSSKPLVSHPGLSPLLKAHGSQNCGGLLYVARLPKTKDRPGRGAEHGSKQEVETGGSMGGIARASIAFVALTIAPFGVRMGVHPDRAGDADAADVRGHVPQIMVLTPKR